jgi:hypothetical protein
VPFSDGTGAGATSLFTGSPTKILDSIGQYQALGVEDFRFDFPSPSIDGRLQGMARFARDVRPHVTA